MTIIQPSRLTYWRFVFAVGALLPLLSIRESFNLMSQLGVDLSVSRSWMALILALVVLGAFSLLLLTSTWSHYVERILTLAESPERLLSGAKWIGGALLVISAIGFTFAFKLPIIELLSRVRWVRVLFFFHFNMLGVFALRSLRRDVPPMTASLSIALCQSVFHLFMVYLPGITDYPFAMGWSETSRYYYPSLFVSELVYGRAYPWPILHPTLHLLLTPPYWFDAPLWVHRAWQTAIRYILVGAVVPALLSRLSIQSGAARWMVGLWMCLFLFMVPVYYHLTIPVILLLWGFSNQDDRRTWAVVILASIWCGWSRVNWYPMPGMIAAVLYLMEEPLADKSLWRYLLKPALWFIAGILTAFGSQRLYIVLSGVPDSSLFYTSLASSLLWYRLLPNASYSLGILAGVALASLAVWVTMYVVIRARKEEWNPLRIALIFAALLVLFLGGIVVSLKIGGGANVHNMDAYFSMLLIVAAYLVFGRFRREDGSFLQPAALPWLLAIALIALPAWSYLQYGVDFKSYEEHRTQKIMTVLQQNIDRVNAQGGEVLFITQRHLIAMHMLKNVTLVPEYEREDLMELAMSNDIEHLGEFQRDMENQRFALIVVDPLTYNIMTKNRSFAAENNVWVRRVMRHILCYYREEVVYPLHDIALYVPREGGRQCPSLAQ